MISRIEAFISHLIWPFLYSQYKNNGLSKLVYNNPSGNKKLFKKKNNMKYGRYASYFVFLIIPLTNDNQNDCRGNISAKIKQSLK